MNPSSPAELTTVPSATLEDLDQQLLQEWLSAHAPSLAADEITLEEALLSLRLAGTMGSRVVPTVAALYAFGREPQWLLPQLGVIAARFGGTSIADEVVARADLVGPIPRLVSSVLEFVDEHSQRVINQVNPDNSPGEFPRVAVREAIVNAVVHRDLRAGGVVTVRMFEGRLEVWSPGPASGLPEPIEAYVSRGGVSLPRNPLTALLARKIGLVEQLGRGLALMHRTVHNETSGEVHVRGTKDGVLVTIPSALGGASANDVMMAN